MTAPVVQSDYEQLEGIGQRFSAQSEENQELYQKLRQQLDALVDGGWIGSAATSFSGEMTGEVLPALLRLTEALKYSSVTVEKIVVILRQAEQEAAALFQGEGGSMPANGGATGPGGAEAPGGGPGGAPTGAVPPPRVYIVNGINSVGNVPEDHPDAYDIAGNRIHGDDQSARLERVLEEHGYDPSQVKSTQAIYQAPLQGTNLQGTNTGFAPLDWLTDKGAAVINKVTGVGASIVGSVYGSGEVAVEYVRGDQGRYTNQIYNEIEADLRANPLLPGQSIVLMGHSGGGAVVTNLPGMLENRLRVDVSGVVTMGSPVANNDDAGRYAEQIVDVGHADDRVRAPLGTPLIRSEESRAVLPLLPVAFSQGLPGTLLGVGGFLTTETLGRRSGPGNVTDVILTRPTDNAHGSYMHDPAVSQDMLREFQRIFPGMNLQVPPRR